MLFGYLRATDPRSLETSLLDQKARRVLLGPHKGAASAKALRRVRLALLCHKASPCRQFLHLSLPQLHSRLEHHRPWPCRVLALEGTGAVTIAQAAARHALDATIRPQYEHIREHVSEIAAVGAGIAHHRSPQRTRDAHGPFQASPAALHRFLRQLAKQATGFGRQQAIFAKPIAPAGVDDHQPSHPTIRHEHVGAAAQHDVGNAGLACQPEPVHDFAHLIRHRQQIGRPSYAERGVARHRHVGQQALAIPGARHGLQEAREVHHASPSPSAASTCSPIR